MLPQETMTECTELLSWAWASGGHSGLSKVKSSSPGKSKSGDSVVGQTLELLMNNVRVLAVDIEHQTNELN